MSYLDDLREIQQKVKKGNQTKIIIDEIERRCSLIGKDPVEKYKMLPAILSARDIIHQEILSAGLNEDVKLTGNLTEKICEIALKAGAPESYSKLPRQWEWVGDFMISGKPFNIFISVKSYSSKERLITSGTGQLAAPIIGYGLFKKKEEWSVGRVRQYLQRGFISIYIPGELLKSLTAEAQAVKNTYGKQFLRDIASLADDLVKGYSKSSDSKFLDLDKF